MDKNAHNPKIYIAPLEGITGYIFRNAYHDIYGYGGKYYAPFISPSENCPMTPRERKDITPENNSGINLVPQILTCRSDCFIVAGRELKDMGYGEVNLNLGCPSDTVCAKGKGAGFLPETTALRKFLDDIYSYAEEDGLKISIKTRLGYYAPEEFYDLVEIFNAFPVSELIVHPRIRSDFYKGEPRREFYAYALEHARCPLVYNGNIYTPEDYDDLGRTFGTPPDTVMLGRGLISDPSLIDKLQGRAEETDFVKFRKLHDMLYHEYQKVMSPDINVLYRMKELWTYWRTLFDGKDREIKRLLKAKKYAEYEEYAYSIIP